MDPELLPRDGGHLPCCRELWVNALCLFSRAVSIYFHSGKRIGSLVGQKLLLEGGMLCAVTWIVWAQVSFWAGGMVPQASVGAHKGPTTCPQASSKLHRWCWVMVHTLPVSNSQQWPKGLQLCCRFTSLASSLKKKTLWFCSTCNHTYTVHNIVGKDMWAQIRSLVVFKFPHTNGETYNQICSQSRKPLTEKRKRKKKEKKIFFVI